MSEQSKRRIVTQSNQLTEARYTLSIAEQRLVTTLLSFISPDDEEFKDYKIKLSEFKKMMGIKSNTVYSNIRTVLRRLKGRVIEIPEENEIFGWFSYSKYIEEEGVVLMRFDKALKPYLLDLKEQFTKYGILVIAQFQSFYTIRIYMLLKQYEFIGYREFELIDLRRILDIEDSKYTSFKEFRRNVINQAKKEFEAKNKETGTYQSDITFDLETIRTGRKITRLRFNIRKQAYQDVLPLNIPEEEPPSPAMQALDNHAVRGALAKQFVEEQGEEEVLRCVALFEAKKKAGEVKAEGAGLLISLLERRAGKKSQADLEAEAKAKQAEERAQQKAKEEILKVAWEEAKKQAVDDFINGLDDEKRQAVEGQFFSEVVEGNPWLLGKSRKQGFDDPVFLSSYKKFVRDNFLQEEILSFDIWKEKQ